MIKTVCRYCKKLNIMHLNINIVGGGNIKSKCNQCGKDIRFFSKGKIVENEKDRNIDDKIAETQREIIKEDVEIQK